jgi:hypothetical protein
MSKLTQDELEDAFIDWYFDDGAAIHFELDRKGYKHVLLGQDLAQHDLSDIGPYAIVTDEFPLGDLLYVKKIGPFAFGKRRDALGLTPVTLDTIRAAKAAFAMSEFGDDETIELIDTHERPGAVLYGDRTHWHQAAVVHPCARPSCKWQGSIFDEFGPVTHVEAETKEEAVRELFEHSAHWVPMRGAVEAVFTRLDGFQYPLHQNPADNGKLKLYEVDLVIVVDRPDLRDESFTHEVAPGHSSFTRWKFSTQREAVSMYEDILAGEYDFASEYVRWVQVFKIDPWGKKTRVVRKKQYRRGRDEPWGDEFKENPPLSGWREAWWLEKMPHDVTKIAYRLKRDALNVFMDWNGNLIDYAFNGPSQKHPTESFDNFNHQFELKGRRRVDSFAKAVWLALPVGGPYYVHDINVNMLNETSPMMNNAGDEILTIPDYAEERRLVDQEAQYWEDKYGGLLPEEDDGEVPF